MAVPDIANTWGDIRQGVKDAEILISQKKYNLSMIKSRQVLELMVNYLCSNASIAEEDLASSVDALYDYQWIDKTTCEHYHKIRMLGNKAVHEGNDDAYDANQAYHLLSQEVYTFANEYKSKKGRSASGGARGGRPDGNRSQNSRSSSGRSSQGRNPGKRPPEGRGGSRNGSSRNRSSASSRSRRRQPASGFSISPVDLVRIGLAVAVIVIIVILVRVLNPNKDKPEDETTTTVPTESFTLPTQPPTTAPVPIETMAETTPAPVYKISADILNVRSEPSTAGEKLGTLENGTIVDYVEDYDDEWAIINYNGTQAYVNKQFLTHD